MVLEETSSAPAGTDAPIHGAQLLYGSRADKPSNFESAPYIIRKPRRTPARIITVKVSKGFILVIIRYCQCFIDCLLLKVREVDAAGLDPLADLTDLVETQPSGEGFELVSKGSARPVDHSLRGPHKWKIEAHSS
tara:strand:+ start:586 stop:990 length:405 start_codon:yes stop_codon:yes gene_type:complete